MSKLAGASSYNPGDPPADPEQLQRYLSEEFAKMAAAITELQSGFMAVVYAPPPKPRGGMLRNADGVTWNPGSGEGIYRYSDQTNTWNYLG